MGSYQNVQVPITKILRIRFLSVCFVDPVRSQYDSHITQKPAQLFVVLACENFPVGALNTPGTIIMASNIDMRATMFCASTSPCKSL
jgi:hypothetical protein